MFSYFVFYWTCSTVFLASQQQDVICSLDRRSVESSSFQNAGNNVDYWIVSVARAPPVRGQVKLSIATAQSVEAGVIEVRTDTCGPAEFLGTVLCEPSGWDDIFFGDADSV